MGGADEWYNHTLVDTWRQKNPFLWDCLVYIWYIYCTSMNSVDFCCVFFFHVREFIQSRQPWIVWQNGQ